MSCYFGPLQALSEMNERDQTKLALPGSPGPQHAVLWNISVKLPCVGQLIGAFLRRAMNHATDVYKISAKFLAAMCLDLRAMIPLLKGEREVGL